jgi:hypothetical protein
MAALERFWSKVEEHRWLAFFALGCAGLFAAFCAHVYLQLATVRPLLVFIEVDGHAPPICGFCVLFP